MRKALLFILTAIIFWSIYSCTPKDEIIKNKGSALRFSTDTVLFDTIFSTVGSVTKRVWVYNDDKNAVNISKINLGGGVTSPYTITINGQQQPSVFDVTLFGGDSMLVLVEVTIDPGAVDNPFIVNDSIVFSTNNNVQDVQLVAWGQDANFLTDSTLSCNITWNDPKPYVVMGKVTVPAGCSLTIEKGTRVLFFDEAEMEVQGTLIVNGAKDTLVEFRDEELTVEPTTKIGHWKGITFTSGSKNNVIQYAIIKNAKSGILMEPEADGDTIPELVISNSIVKNMAEYAIVGYNTDYNATNCLFTNCIINSAAGLGGGNYNFTHCTVTNYGFDFFRQGAAIQFKDQGTYNMSSINNNLDLNVNNSIVWGSWTEELDVANNGAMALNWRSNNNIYKTGKTITGAGNDINSDPVFNSPVECDFELDISSPAVDKGPAIGVTIDIQGDTRDANPDTGAYEN